MLSSCYPICKILRPLIAEFLKKWEAGYKIVLGEEDWHEPKVALCLPCASFVITS